MPGSWEIAANRKVLVYTIHTENTTMAWAAAFRRLIIPGEFMFLTGMPFDHARNAAVQQFLASPFQWLFSIDSDVVAPPDTILRLMNRNLPIVSALYCRRSPPHAVPVMIKNGQWVTNYTPGSLVEVDWVGAGALLIHRSIFERMPPQRPGHPWFDWRVNLRGTGVVPDDTCLSEDFTFCFPSGTWVIGDLGINKIENMNIGDVVLSHDGRMNKILDKSNRKYSGEMVTILANYVRNIETTANHRFYVKSNTHNKDELIWLESKYIKPDDWLYIPKFKWNEDVVHPTFINVINTIKQDLHTFSNGLLGYKRTRKAALKVKPELEVTPSLCRLIGYYIAEGFSSKKKHVLQFAFHKEEEYFKDCQELLKTCFNAKSSLFYKENNKGVRVVSSSTILGHLFTSLVGDNAYDKHFPEFWTKLNKECLKELIKGYWCGDGHYGKRSFSFKTMSERLARELQVALLKLNIMCSITTAKNKYGIVYIGLISRSHADRFSEIVNYNADELKRDSYKTFMKEVDDGFLVKVINVTYTNKEIDVYNIKVADSESYTANMVAVHNCQHAKRTLGVSTYVDTSIVCKHCGSFEVTPNKVEPLSHN